MKLGPVTELHKRNKATLKKFDDDFMSENGDVIVIFLVYSHFGAIQKPDSGSIACKTFINNNVFINSNSLSYKN